MSSLASFTSSNNQTDQRYLISTNRSNKSLFAYQTDLDRFVNQDTCFQSAPPFINSPITGISNERIQIESNLKGITNSASKCQECNFTPANADLAQNKLLLVNPFSLPQCAKTMNPMV
jgi:hypothetical protein